jgi:hypothetical protein
MNFISLNSEENKNYLMEKDILSAFNQVAVNPTNINQGMSPKQIAEVVSDHLMAVVKKQFDTAKQNYQAKSMDKK